MQSQLEALATEVGVILKGRDSLPDADVKLLEEISADIELFLEKQRRGNHVTLSHVTEILVKIAQLFLDNMQE